MFYLQYLFIYLYLFVYLFITHTTFIIIITIIINVYIQQLLNLVPRAVSLVRGRGARRQARERALGTRLNNYCHMHHANYIPLREWSVKGPQTIEKSLRVYKPTQNTICEALNNSLLLSCVCKLKDSQFNYIRTYLKRPVIKVPK